MSPSARPPIQRPSAPRRHGAKAAPAAPKPLAEPPSPLTQLHFACTYAEIATLPREGLPEIAFVGRSNAGKSSAINALAQQNKLAFVSKTPGRTQHFNFFGVPASGQTSAPDIAYLVDLPGYGFAQVGMGVKSRWSANFSSYLATRQPLVALALLMDIRHPLTDLDEQLLQIAIEAGRPLLILLTKADKVGQAQIAQTQRQTHERVTAMRNAIGGVQEDATPLAVMPFSVLKRTGIVAARQWVEAALELQQSVPT
jgi:GTP-binding protein